MAGWARDRLGPRSAGLSGDDVAVLNRAKSPDFNLGAQSDGDTE